MMIDYEKILPFVREIFENLDDRTSILVLSDFLKDHNDFRGLLLSIPLFALANKPTTTLPVGENEKVPGFSFICKWLKPNAPLYPQTYLLPTLQRRISALFGIGLTLKYVDKTKNSLFKDDKPIGLGQLATSKKLQYSFKLFQHSEKPPIATLFTHYFVRMWLFNAGLLSLEDRDTDRIQKGPTRFERVFNHSNFTKLEWHCFGYDYISLFRSPVKDTHVKIARRFRNIQSLVEKKMLERCAFDIPDLTDFNNDALHSATHMFIHSDLLNEIRSNLDNFFKQSPVPHPVRNGPARIFV